MTYNWYDTRASTWYEGYDPNSGTGQNQGNFVDLSTLDPNSNEYATALSAVTNNILGLFEQKGLTAAQIRSNSDFTSLVDRAKAGDTKGAFQDAAAYVPSAADRGDLWGADASEGGDAMRGRSFLEHIAAGGTIPFSGAMQGTDSLPQGSHHTVGSGTVDSHPTINLPAAGTPMQATVTDLYRLGMGRDPDAEGLAYWQDAIDTRDDWDIAKVAESFLASDEAEVRDVYHRQYGRDELGFNQSGQSHVNYWVETNDEAVSGESDAEAFERIITYRGEDLDGDGTITADERNRSRYNVMGETMVRDDLQNIMGQVSNEANRSGNPFFTDATNTDVQRYVDHIDEGRGVQINDDGNAISANIDLDTGERLAGVGNRDASYDNSLFTNTHIAYRGTTMDALNQGDADDATADNTGDSNVNEGTRMGRFGTVEEVRDYMDEHSGVDSDDLSAAQDSGAFSRDVEDITDYGRTVFEDVHDGTPATTWGAVTHEDPTKEYIPWNEPFGDQVADGSGASRNLSGWAARKLIHEDNINDWEQNMWAPSWGDTGTSGNIGVDRDRIDYMPKLSSNVQDTSGYQSAKRGFDAATGPSTLGSADTGKVGQRLTGTSAKGVRMKRSKASKAGRSSLGTGQLARNNMQIKSLNI